MDCNRVRASLRELLAWVDEIESEQRELTAIKMAPKHDPAAPEPYIDSQQAAALLGQHVHTVIRWARQGKIPADRFGKEWRFLSSELRTWAEDQRRRRTIHEDTFAALPENERGIWRGGATKVHCNETHRESTTHEG